jgi:DNA-binding NtrC family response regulator
MPMKRNPNAPYWLAIEHKEREIIDGALLATCGNVTRAASALGIDRTYLTKIMKRLEIDRKSYKAKEVST